jgi:hypothetical protein
MRLSRTTTLLWCTLVPVTAQEAVRRAPAAEPPPAALQRATLDAEAACRNLLAYPHAFTGTVRFVAGRKPAIGDDAEVAFRGAWHDGLEFLQLGEHSVLTHGDRQLVSEAGGEWKLPQGDAPDCPFSPVMVAKHLAAATVEAWEPTAHCDRPAVRIRASWSGDAADHLLHEAHHPAAKTEALLERFPLIRQRQPDRVRVDATVCIDPASRSFYGAVLRVAVLDVRERPAEEPPPPCPDGLLPLPRATLLEYSAAVSVVGPNEVQVPQLDDTMRERLAWPPAQAPAAAPPVRR